MRRALIEVIGRRHCGRGLRAAVRRSASTPSRPGIVQHARAVRRRCARAARRRRCARLGVTMARRRLPPPMILRHEFAPIDNRRLAHLVRPHRRAPAHHRVGAGRAHHAPRGRLSHRRRQGARRAALAVLARTLSNAPAHALDAAGRGAGRRGAPNRATPAGDDETASPVLANPPCRPRGPHAQPGAVPAPHPVARPQLSASGRPAPARPFSRWPAPSMRWSAARCSASC